MSNSRPMFWRIVRRLLIANRGRLVVILLALGAGAAVTAALLNIQVDANRRLTTEFRSFGANVVIAPRNDGSPSNRTITEDLLDRIPSTSEGNEVTKTASLYLLVEAKRRSRPRQVPDPIDGAVPRDERTVKESSPDDALSADRSIQAIPVILVGFTGQNAQHIWPSEIREGAGFVARDTKPCRVGKKAAAALQVRPGEYLSLRNRAKEDICFVSTIEEFGGAEDNQLFTDLYSVQRLAFTPAETVKATEVSIIQLNVPGTPRGISQYIAALQKKLPDADVHGIRQFTEAEAKIYNRISGLLNATVVVVLILTTLCVMAAMTNVAMERKNDVGLMKAIGGATRRVLRLFLAEAAMLGLIAGIIGAAAGLALSIALGKAVFGVAAQPRLIVYPISVTLTILVAMAGAYPLRRLATIRPASIFRGE